jgi:hypothetical protein
VLVNEQSLLTAFAVLISGGLIAGAIYGRTEPKEIAVTVAGNGDLVVVEGSGRAQTVRMCQRAQGASWLYDDPIGIGYKCGKRFAWPE